MASTPRPPSPKVAPSSSRMTSTMRSPAISELPNAEMTVGEAASREERASRDSKKGASAVREQVAPEGATQGSSRRGSWTPSLLPS